MDKLNIDDTLVSIKQTSKNDIDKSELETDENDDYHASIQYQIGRYYHTLVKCCPLGIIIISHSKILYVNDRLVEMFGYTSANQLVNKLVSTIQAPEVLEILRQRGEKREKGEKVLSNYETIGLRKDGSRIPIQVYASLLHINEVPATLGFIEDITEKKKVERREREIQFEHQQNQKIEGIGLLAGGIAHEFNNILVTIYGIIDLLKLENLNDRQSELLDELFTVTDRASDLSKTLITFSKGGEPILKYQPIIPIIEKAANNILSSTDRKFLLSSEAKDTNVNVDKNQIYRVLYSLFENAVDASHINSTIEIKLTNEKIENHPFLENALYVKITIKDQGIGIPVENRDKIFIPYFTTKTGGTGLGLAIAYSIIKNHHGYLTFNSEIDKGSEFYIYLPTRKAKKRRRKSLKNSRKTIEGLKILIMDDDHNLTMVLQKIFKHLKVDIVIVPDGKDVIELYKKERPNFDLIIMDLTIPGGMGGKQTIRKLRKINTDVKVVVSSGYSSDPIMSRYREHGFDAALPKPYTLSEIKNLLESII